jgi:ABC-type branched-subunit amino acid transport system permease subunit
VLRLLDAIREDEVAAEALRIDATRYKLGAFVLSAVFPVLAGGIQAYKVLYLDPPSVFFVQITSPWRSVDAGRQRHRHRPHPGGGDPRRGR